MKQFIKNGEVRSLNRIVVIKDDLQYLAPTEEMVLEDGWTEYIPPTKTEQELAIERKEEELKLLLDQLASSDYKIIKCMEAFLCKEPLPYNIEELHEFRNSQRAEINNLTASNYGKDR